jgi:dihydrofolate reductase
MDTAQGPDWAVAARPVAGPAMSASVVAETIERSTGMGKIIVSENITLDGVVQDPTGEEGFKHGGWFTQVSDKDREEWAKVALDEALATEAMLLGRRSYEYLAARWPSRTGPLADRLNTKPKYVVSSTLQAPAWNNSTVLPGDPVTEASKLKQHLAGDIIVAASFQLVRTLIAHDLVDELRLMIYPFVLGSGERLLAETTDKLPLRLAANRTVGNNLAYLTYQLVRPA